MWSHHKRSRTNRQTTEGANENETIAKKQQALIQTWLLNEVVSPKLLRLFIYFHCYALNSHHLASVVRRSQLEPPLARCRDAALGWNTAKGMVPQFYSGIVQRYMNCPFRNTLFSAEVLQPQPLLLHTHTLTLTQPCSCLLKKKKYIPLTFTRWNN